MHRFPPYTVNGPNVISRKLPDNRITWEDKPTDCVEELATMCETTTSFGVTTIKGTPTTTMTATPSVCQTILGCDLEDEDKTKTTTKGAACTKPPKARAERIGKRAPVPSTASNNPVASFYPKTPGGWPDVTGEPSWDDDWDGCELGRPAICVPVDNGKRHSEPIRRRLMKSGVEFKEIRSEELDHTGYFYIDSLPQSFLDKLINWKRPVSPLSQPRPYNLFALLSEQRHSSRPSIWC